FLTLVCGPVFAQNDSTAWNSKIDADKAHFILSGGVVFQKYPAGEIGVIYGYSSAGGPCNPGGLGGLKLAAEFNFGSPQFYLAPKLALEIDFLALGMRLNIIDYTNF